MRIPLAGKIAVTLIALLSLLWLPWAVSLVLMFLAGLSLPWVAVALGIFADLLYYPGHGLPWATIIGIGIAIAAAAVRHFVKTRIM